MTISGGGDIDIGNAEGIFTRAQIIGKRMHERMQQWTSLQEKARFVFQHRWLVVKRRQNFREHENEQLQTMVQYLPALGTLRTFMDEIYALFRSDQTPKEAEDRRQALVRNEAFSSIPELALVQAMLTPEKFAKMTAFLQNPAARKVHTNNQDRKRVRSSDPFFLLAHGERVCIGAL